MATSTETTTLKTRFGEIQVSKNVIEGDFSTIPVIDLSNLRSPILAERKKLATEIYDVCHNIGFFYIKNHGILKASVAKIHDTAHKFFALDLDKKMEAYMGQSKSFRGYTPLAGSHQDTSLTDMPKGNLAEYYDIGYEAAADSQGTQDVLLPEDSAALYGNNIWPKEDSAPSFQTSMLDYYSQMLDLSRALLRIFALSLDLPENYFDSMVKHPTTSTMRISYYPPQEVGMEREGISAHTDYECFTILSQDTVPALQVLNSSNQWVLATPIPDTFVVNIGDFLKFWTNGIFKSTLHRAKNLSGKQRYSVPFFFGIDYDTMVSVLPSCMSADNPPILEGAVKAGEYVKSQLANSQVNYGEKAPNVETVPLMIATEA